MTTTTTTTTNDNEGESDSDVVAVAIARRDRRTGVDTTTTDDDDDDDDDDGRRRRRGGVGNESMVDDLANEGVPTWFDADVFNASTFDAMKYIDEMTTFVSGEALSEQLAAYEKKIRDELGTLVNENYEEFASLGDDLPDYEALKRQVDEESQEIREKLARKREELVQALERLEASAAEREASARASANKQLVDECAHTVSKVERLLGELDVREGEKKSSEELRDENDTKVLATRAFLIDAADREGLDMLEPVFEDQQANVSDAAEDMHQSHVSDNVDERARMLDRVASEVNRLHFYQKQGKDLPLIRDLSDRIEYCELKLTTLVQSALLDGLMDVEKNSNVISHCLHACTGIGKMDVVETAIRSICIQPAVEKVLEDAREDDFVTVLQKVTDAALNSCAHVLELTRKVDSGLHSNDFLAGTILAEVDAQLSAAQSNAFSPGIPKVFIKNYSAAMDFLSKLENKAATAASLNNFRASKHLEVFMKRWNLPVYYSLRFQEFAGDVDDELNKPGLDTSLASDGFLLTSTTQTWRTMSRCMADDVYVPALADKFIRLMAQVLARYKSWVNNGIEALAIQQNTESTGESTVALGANKSNWGATAGGEELILVRLDVERLCERVSTAGVESVKAGTKSLGEEASEVAASCILEGVKDVEALVPKLSEFIIKVFVDRCVEALKQLKGITATFRMTNKPMPTRHSHFVPMILAPLQAFLDAERTKMLSKASRLQIVSQVVEAVCEKYTEMASELVSTVKKTEASLNRLKDRQGKTSSAGVGDTDKICRQLYLDAKEFATQIEKLGINVKDSKTFASLWAAVESGIRESESGIGSQPL